MSLVAAISRESVSPAELMEMGKRDIEEVWIQYDANSNGTLELDEFSSLLCDALDLMSAQLPKEIPTQYCKRFNLDPRVLGGLEDRIRSMLNQLPRVDLCARIFNELDTERNGSLKPEQLREMHQKVDQYVLQELNKTISQVMIQKQLQAAGVM